MAKQLFKKYNKNESIKAVQITNENIGELAERLGGELSTDMGRDVLVLPGIPEAVEGYIGWWVAINPTTGRYDTWVDEQFREEYVVPVPREEREATDGDSAE